MSVGKCSVCSSSVINHLLVCNAVFQTPSGLEAFVLQAVFSLKETAT